MVDWAAADAVILSTFGEDLIWRVAGAGDGATISVIVSEPDAEVSMFSQAVRVPSLVMSVDASLGVAIGDTIERAGAEFTVRAIDRDPQAGLARLSMDATAVPAP